MSSEAARKPTSVLRNTLLLVGAQLAGAPLAIVINGVMGRTLGAGAFGYAYLAWTLVSFGFLLVDWGNSGVLPAAVARDRSRSGVLLGTSIVWRLGSACVVTAGLALGCWALGYPLSFQVVLGLVALQALFNILASAIQEVVRGFERTDADAIGKLGLQVATAALVIPTLLLGGKLNAVLAAQAAASALILLLVRFAARRVGITRMSFDRGELKGLISHGRSFLIFSFAMTLQGNIDAIFLSKLASVEVVGWFAAAQRLTGILAMPALALIGALYPALARLFTEDYDGYLKMGRTALRGTLNLAVPVALGCALFRRVGVSLFSQKSFGPTEQNLLVLSALMFLVYISMPLGSTILAAGRQRRFAWAQLVCVVVSIVLDPQLIPLFQARFGNGGLGVCVSSVVSESLMVASAIYIAPRGIVDRTLLFALGKACVAGGAMTAFALLLQSVTPYVIAPLSLGVYVGALWLVRGVDRQQLSDVLTAVRRKRGV